MKVKFTGWAHARHYEGTHVSGKLIAAGEVLGNGEKADGLYDVTDKAGAYLLATFPEAFTDVTASAPAPEPAKPAKG